MRCHLRPHACSCAHLPQPQRPSASTHTHHFINFGKATAAQTHHPEVRRGWHSLHGPPPALFASGSCPAAVVAAHRSFLLALQSVSQRGTKCARTFARLRCLCSRVGHRRLECRLRSCIPAASRCYCTPGLCTPRIARSKPGFAAPWPMQRGTACSVALFKTPALLYAMWAWHQ